VIAEFFSLATRTMLAEHNKFCLVFFERLLQRATSSFDVQD